MASHRVVALKCWPLYFQDVADGRKTLEIRKDDRNFVVDDILELQEWVPSSSDKGQGEYTGRWCRVTVTHILRDPQFVRDGYAALSVRLDHVGE